MYRPAHRAQRERKTRVSLLVMGVLALLLPAGFLFSGPASADGDPQDTCDKLGYSKIDKSSGSHSGDFGSFTWEGTTLTYNLNEGYTAEFCLKSSTDIRESGELTGSGTFSTGTVHGISHIGYIIRFEEPRECPAGTTWVDANDNGMVDEGECEETPPPPTCPEDSLVNAGEVIPPGQTAEEYCNPAGQQATACPSGSDRAGEVVPEGQTAKEFCNKNNLPPNPPNPEGEQEASLEVAGKQQQAPARPAPAAVPSLVDAGR